MTHHILQRVQRFNQGRNPERLKLKYAHMQENSFVFYRGTCHLFYEDWPREDLLNNAPPVWVSGDLHLQNFGCFKGDNRLVYFDLNDFDESALAPCSWELARLLTSIHVASRTLNLGEADALDLATRCLRAYAAALSIGKAKTVERETAKGMVRELLESIEQRKRKDFLDKKTEKKGDKRWIILDGKHSAPVTPEERKAIEEFMALWAISQEEPGFYQILDVAHRIAGVGSLGVDRYILLVEGKGSPDKNYLLDLKEELPSSLNPYLTPAQPHRRSEAERVVAIQQRAQAISPALLTPVTIRNKPYVLHELQPTEDKIDLTSWLGKLSRLEDLVETMGEVTAWSHLRSSGRQGSSIADGLIEFSQSSEWKEELLGYAASYAKQVEADYQEYCGETI